MHTAQVGYIVFTLLSTYFWFSDRHNGFLERVKYDLMHRLVANSNSGKVAKAHPLIPSGLEMAAKIVIWGWFHPPP